MNRILHETGSVSIRFIRFIPSWTLNATSRNLVRFPRKLGSFFPSFFPQGMAVVSGIRVEEVFAVAIDDADVHWAGLEVDSAVELGGGLVVVHG